MKYEIDLEIKQQAEDIVRKLNFNHVKLNDVVCIKSYGSKTRGTIARCHGLGKVMQKALGRKGFYVLEFLSERFDKMSEEDKTKTIIHELLHIPNTFGGGFKHHNYVTDREVEKMFRRYMSL